MSISLFLFLFGSIIAFYGIWWLLRVRAILGWQKGQARITEIDETLRIVSEAGMQGRYYVPKVEYEYQVGDTKYRSNRFSIHNFTLGFKVEISEILRHAKVGENIDIFFNPKRPAQACIRKPESEPAIVAVFLGSFILGVSLLIRFAT